MNNINIDELGKESNNNENTDNILIENKEIGKMVRGSKISNEELKKMLDTKVHGVIARLHPKPYPNYSYYGQPREQQYWSKMSYEFLGEDDPYAKVDENLRMLKLYTDNDVENYYDKDGNKNPKKMPENRYNQYYQKGIYFFPNKNNQEIDDQEKTSKGGRKKTNKKKIKKKKKNKNKSRKRKNIKKRI
jgi:hypothetical protein